MCVGECVCMLYAVGEEMCPLGEVCATCFEFMECADGLDCLKNR